MIDDNIAHIFWRSGHVAVRIARQLLDQGLHAQALTATLRLHFELATEIGNLNLQPFAKGAHPVAVSLRLRQLALQLFVFVL